MQFSGELFRVLLVSNLGSSINWLKNGNAETGPCNLVDGVTNPTDWNYNYNGTITQIHYNDTHGDLFYTSPGPR